MSYLHFTSELCSPDQMPFMKHSDFWLTSRDLSEKENANSFFAENRTRDGQYQSGRLFFTPQGKGIEDELRTSILNMFGPIHIQFHFCENYWGSGRNYFLVEFKANSILTVKYALVHERDFYDVWKPFPIKNYRRWEDLTLEQKEQATETYLILRETEEGRGRNETNPDYPDPIDPKGVESCTFSILGDGYVQVNI